MHGYHTGNFNARVKRAYKYFGSLDRSAFCSACKLALIGHATLRWCRQQTSPFQSFMLRKSALWLKIPRLSSLPQFSALGATKGGKEVHDVDTDLGSACLGMMPSPRNLRQLISISDLAPSQNFRGAFRGVASGIGVRFRKVMAQYRVDGAFIIYALRQ